VTDIRQALLDDTQQLCALFRTRVSVWQRWNAQGQVEDLPYEALTLYQRWLHGSRGDAAWMSVETGAIWLSHLLSGAGYPIVAADNGSVMAYAEVYHSSEPEPFGDHLHLAHIVVHPDKQSENLEDMLIQRVIEQARAMMDCRRITVSLAGYDSESTNFYAGSGFAPIAHIQRYALPARTGQSFYKATDHPNADQSQIRGWYMSVGRLEDARQHWEHLWPRLFDAVPEIRDRHTQRLHLSAAGQEAFLCCQAQLYDPRTADVYCWSPKPLTSQLLVAIRDWAHREGYRTLVLAVSDEISKLLGTEAEADPHSQQVYALDL
jgi:GNAT superfamily N-acetyltransferase